MASGLDPAHVLFRVACVRGGPEAAWRRRKGIRGGCTDCHSVKRRHRTGAGPKASCQGVAYMALVATPKRQGGWVWGHGEKQSWNLCECFGLPKNKNTTDHNNIVLLHKKRIGYKREGKPCLLFLNCCRPCAAPNTSPAVLGAQRLLKFKIKDKNEKRKKSFKVRGLAGTAQGRYGLLSSSG